MIKATTQLPGANDKVTECEELLNDNFCRPGPHKPGTGKYPLETPQQLIDKAVARHAAACESAPNEELAVQAEYIEAVRLANARYQPETDLSTASMPQRRKIAV